MTLVSQLLLLLRLYYRIGKAPGFATIYLFLLLKGCFFLKGTLYLFFHDRSLEKWHFLTHL